MPSSGATYRRYLLVVLTTFMVFNYVDRLALGLLLQDIKVDLQLTDTQLGLLTGIAFALFYAVMGIPIARWADRGNRVTIISLSAILWSLAVGLSAAAMSFTQLLFIRIGVAVGEAGCQPPAFSLIGDYFSRAERPRAIARYQLGWPLALIIGFFGAGWLNELYGWRATFVIIAVPGIALGILARLTLQEPRSTPGGQPSGAVAAGQNQSFREVVQALWRSVTFRRLMLCLVLSYFFGNGILQWEPAFFLRSFGLTTGELGTWFSVLYGLGGLLGIYVGGELASRCAADDERLQLRAMSVMFVVVGVLYAGVHLAETSTQAFVFLALCVALGYTTIGPIFAATQALVPARMRATSIAIVLFFCHLIGLGLGPLTVGALSDALSSRFGEESLRYALVAMSPGYLCCAWYMWRASQSVTREMAGMLAQENL